MDAILLNERDNVATALRALPAGAMARIGGVSTQALRVVEAIPLLHKIALVDLGAGSLVTKYGEVIGAMMNDAAAGSVVHVHNMRSRRAQQAPYASPVAGGDAVADAAAQVDSTSAMRGLQIESLQRPGTIENLARLLEMVRPLLAFVRRSGGGRARPCALVHRAAVGGGARRRARPRTL